MNHPHVVDSLSFLELVLPARGILSIELLHDSEQVIIDDGADLTRHQDSDLAVRVQKVKPGEVIWRGTNDRNSCKEENG